ncbi:MAG: nucleoside-diphosphate kinase [Candidatus Glassbacteria bacterium RBG_16_58_8]|uniref:Nucleoside diphosphate kinase n=1 Tax=Candidatus Glassbacteria bacterium RBG_16_58_8 TaxID=1817866 RepID=A0A1F5YC08_9BACT|nr:MAG: nucleoside-diphosphate kinase [Candidatus Glassbacteria bacterium RBG_16_58_8]
MVERTLALIKPDAVSGNLEQVIQKRLEGAGFKILQARREQLTRDEAMEFYRIHAGKPFYASLVEFMSSGSIVVLLLEKENAIQDLREVIGTTDPKKAGKGTIRADYASSVEKNAIHASDSPETAREEISFFFSKLEALRLG